MVFYSCAPAKIIQELLERVWAIEHLILEQKLHKNFHPVIHLEQLLPIYYNNPPVGIK